MQESADSAPNKLSAMRWRAVGFLAFWLVLSGFSLSDLPAGIVATVAATWASLRLLAPKPLRLSALPLCQLALRFLRQSIVAGVDTACRALDPQLPLRPGFIIYQTAFPPGARRDAFSTMVSLLPGTLPSGSNEGGGLIVHCLDVDQAIQQQLAAEEARFTLAFGEEQRHG